MNKEEQHCYFWHATCMLINGHTRRPQNKQLYWWSRVFLKEVYWFLFSRNSIVQLQIIWVNKRWNKYNLTTTTAVCVVEGIFNQIFSHKTQIIIIMYCGKITHPIYQLMVVSLHYIHDTQTYFSRVLTKCIRMIVIYILKFYNYC